MSRPGRTTMIALVGIVMADLCLWTLDRYSPVTAAVLLAIALPPWLAIAFALGRGTRHAPVYAILTIAPYLAYGLMEAFANPGARHHAEGFIALLVGLFLSLVWELRVSRSEARAPI